MNILILGCSFGVPGQYPGCVPEDHTERQLKKLGHTVYNCSQCAGSNINSLTRAKKFLAGETILCPEVNAFKITGPTQTLQESFDVDWVVWFHTELMRDAVELDTSMDYAMQLVYTQYFDFVNELGAKLAVIGGAGPVHPSLFDHGSPDFCISSWFNEILKLDLPQIQTLSQLDVIEKLQDIGIATKINMLEQHAIIRKALEDSDDFPDNYHPGNRPHRELAKRLHQIFTV